MKGKARIWSVRTHRGTKVQWWITWPAGDVSPCSSFQNAIAKLDAAIDSVNRQRRGFELR